MPKTWKKTPDKTVRHIWQCDNDGCKEKAVISPDWYQQNGTPVCSDCDTDMEYQHTEVKS